MGRPPVQHHKQIIELGPDLKRALEDGSIRELVVLHETAQVAKATLGNPVAFPILFALAGMGVGVLILKYLYPALPDVAFPIAKVRESANSIARWIKEHDPGFVPATEDALATASRVLGELLFKIWDGIVKLPPIL